uniref:Uncharacterized protein n=1 Tax=Rhizophora mucronata TaxID=61149 RepID=A0A2P2NUL2_RHIMU
MLKIVCFLTKLLLNSSFEQFLTSQFCAGVDCIIASVNEP